jgi:hypothetical protein
MRALFHLHHLLKDLPGSQAQAVLQSSGAFCFTYTRIRAQCDVLHHAGLGIGHNEIDPITIMVC